MLTRVVAKKQRQQKSKTNCKKKKFKRILSCLLGGRGKVQFRRKRLGDKVQAKSSNLPCRFCSNSVGTPLEFAAFCSGFDAKYSRTGAFWFFLSTTMVFTAFPTHFARKKFRRPGSTLSEGRNFFPFFFFFFFFFNLTT